MGLSSIGPGQWLIILLIIVLLFGAKKIPELAKGLGKGIKTFKSEMSNDEDEANKNSAKLEEKPDAKVFTSDEGIKSDEQKKA
ncbi:twin-arginine translocase TatA/TatE family subunit [Campylobacter sp. MIT 12-8780]|uniref:twin-arginine translocase TatA/TatE family subunit n=1 Tax=unclassified Campylobacter TaxID=2593542 RepID=UPI0010F75DB1|nr:MULTISPECIES: twin-arginine translocase TatA/TatE family subunit [unclassified Campylobacter]NDJ26800.1 twin-arginine translocase TatA/TatE family subunit [Campylobacter sp. MIT 19-121]TKX30128.1 twin-arginine translocase TatA/TatE family subunit [Campylobacter sp. MIT 12-5580]TQR42379.1 twin-arginine translocase TatA/TatE family subunit [Campylobacter sp. MIT 12-8780]